MGYTNDESGDLEKLQKAFADITSKFGSLDNLLEAFGLAHMPAAQRYGILFGCIVFVFTVSAVLALLILGGSFQRIAEQSKTGEATMMSPHDARAHRSLLLERLLEGRERMMQQYTDPPKTEGLTPITELLLNVDPQAPAADLVDQRKREQVRAKLPPYYEENYAKAYRKCQDKPGGAALSGRPEARFEAYARGFAGCGPYTSLAYRRSYGRMYEAICCKDHASDDKYLKRFSERPHDIIGRYVHLEALEVARHLQAVYRVTSGEPALENKAFDPNEIWGFFEDGPFDNAEEMRESFVFQHYMHEAAFAVVHAVTEKVMGVVLLSHNDPKNLTIQLEPPILQPKREGSAEQMETCFLLMDRLFAYGYRRIQMSLDSQDSEKRKMAMRLGFTLEGVHYKHMVVKDANRDSSIYSLLNSDWNRGARAALFKKLYGAEAVRVDQTNEKKEEEVDVQERMLKEKRQQEEASKQKKL